MTIRVALHNLFQSRTRLLVSTGGVALALLLILALDGIMAGFQSRIVAYIDNAGAQVWVAQAGVRNLHMTSSSLPGDDVTRVAAVPGVANATAIRYMTDIIRGPSGQSWSYIIGLPADAASGAPPRAQGKRIPGPGETVVDRSVAESMGVTMGGRLSVYGRSFRITGLSEGTASPLLAVMFISTDDFAALRGMGDSISYVLVQARSGTDADALAARIEQSVPGVTAQSRQRFGASEQATIQNMSSGIIAIMNSAAFLVGLAVVAVTVYTATLARRAEYGTLKAVGAGNRRLYGIVVTQAVVSVAVALVAGILLTVLLSVLVPVVQPQISVELVASSVLKTSLVAVAIAMLAAVIPVRQVAGLDPAAVFRRRVT